MEAQIKSWESVYVLRRNSRKFTNQAYKQQNKMGWGEVAMNYTEGIGKYFFNPQVLQVIQIHHKNSRK